ncbi:DUF4123 domain-containing protein [Pseudomonas sp. SWRI81]|uniref:DUF4123 domain-containing protein n=1 Tax=Pseudomonas sp. SWRI81 TaxID=2745505 RepID=UPI0016462BE5|nr:DUF4123 domain-containing protein [Pseudomonas sp. SWRI81]MBC3268916.1 DUF4123 domain-containing protein [Pseudomonas sp. SWRI81]
MHVKALSALLSEPRYNFSDLPVTSESLCFIIDQGLQPDALGRLYRVGEPVVAHGLFVGTDLAEIPEEPLWLVAPKGGKVAKVAAELCEERFSGIAISTPDPEKALAHARWLLRANDGSGGQSLLSFHKPSLWAALAYTADKAFDQLLGCWNAVYSPAPIHFGQERGRWLVWTTNGESTWSGDRAAFNLPEAAAKVQARLGWVYWVDEEYAAFNEPDDDRLNDIADNLDLLLKHNIYDGDHLLKLGPVVNGPLFETQLGIMAILQSKDESFIKVDRLLESAAVAQH